MGIATVAATAEAMSSEVFICVVSLDGTVLRDDDPIGRRFCTADPWVRIGRLSEGSPLPARRLQADRGAGVWPGSRGKAGGQRQIEKRPLAELKQQIARRLIRIPQHERAIARQQGPPLEPVFAASLPELFRLRRLHVEI